MTDSRSKRIALGALVAVAAGVASALLFMLASRGSFLVLALAFLAPLPVMIASLSYGLTIGASAALVGAASVAIVFQHPLVGTAYLLSTGAPAALITAAAVLASPRGEQRARDLAPTFAVLTAALTSGLSVAGALAFMSWGHGGFAALLAKAVAAFAPVLKQILDETHASSPIDIKELARFLAESAPAEAAVVNFLTMVVCLWLAGRIARISGNLPRPWPSLPDDLALPAILGALFAASCGLVFLGGLPGVISSIFAAVLTGTFALQGLALVHVLTRGSTLRFALLFSLYALIALLPPWPLLFLAIAGLADAALHLRTRKSASTPKNA